MQARCGWGVLVDDLQTKWEEKEDCKEDEPREKRDPKSRQISIKIPGMRYTDRMPAATLG